MKKHSDTVCKARSLWPGQGGLHCPRHPTKPNPGCCESHLLQKKRTLNRLWTPMIHPPSSRNVIARAGWTHAEILRSTHRWPGTLWVNTASKMPFRYFRETARPDWMLQLVELQLGENQLTWLQIWVTINCKYVFSESNVHTFLHEKEPHLLLTASTRLSAVFMLLLPVLIKGHTSSLWPSSVVLLLSVFPSCSLPWHLLALQISSPFLTFSSSVTILFRFSISSSHTLYSHLHPSA